MSAVGPVTLLFTDLVSAPELSQAAGDEPAQRAFRAHHRLVQTAVLAHGGPEVKWIGDGFMTAFASTADAVRCAVTIQQAARRRASGARLAIRIGLHAAEVLREETDYFGPPVVITRQLCNQAQPGQILCSSVVAGLLAGRQAFSFRHCSTLALPGLSTPVGISEILHQPDVPGLLTATAFVGRAAELDRLRQALVATCAGHGCVVMLAGEPGIGKTRTMEEFAETAREQGALVLRGVCFQGEWAPPYGPVADALAEGVRGADPEQLRTELGLGAAPLARLVPALRETLPDIPEPVALQPDEERFRLLDAVAQYLIAVSTRVAVVVVLDDLQWADKGTIAMLRHVARFAPRHRILLIGGYRDVEVERTHPLLEALGGLPRETSYEHLALKGLATDEVQELLETIADRALADSLVTAISIETSGNPFFIREVLLHLVEERKIVRRDGSWVSEIGVGELGIPESVRRVIERRLARLSGPGNRFLSAAAGFTGSVRFDIAARVAGLDESQALDAVDEAIAAHLLTPGRSGEYCDFAHALVRHTLYEELNPPRRLRLHRKIAEAMVEIYGDPSASSGRGGLVEHAGEIAEHYHRSAALPGAERGVEHALAAADRAEALAAPDEAATFLRIALALLPRNAAQRPRILGRLGLALIGALAFEEALPVACQAGDLIAEIGGNDAAADYLALATLKMKRCGFARGAWALATKGLSYIADRRDAAWAVFMANDIPRREAEREGLGVAVDSSERATLAHVIDTLPEAVQHELDLRSWRLFRSRAEILASRNIEHLKFIGEYRRDLPEWEGLAAQAERDGQIGRAVWLLANVARCHNALGNFTAARAMYKRGTALARRLPIPGFPHVNLRSAADEMHLALDEGWAASVAGVDTVAPLPAEERWAAAATYAAYARILARLGRSEPALHLLAGLVGPIERAPGWADNYNRIACDAAAVLWLLERTDYIEVLQRNVREKVVGPDFRCPMQDGRLALARLCALEGRHDEAVEWFAKARAVLDEQGARPLRAIVDFDEALMYVRRGDPGDGERALPLLDLAEEQFRAIGMTGWIKRAEELRAQLGAPPSVSPSAAGPAAEPVTSPPASPALAPEGNLFRREGDYWTIAFDARTIRVKDSKGLGYLAHLLRHPGHELHVFDLVALGTDAVAHGDRRRASSDGHRLLDERAKGEYKRRLDELREELAEAEGNSDIGRVANAREEIESITEQLAAAIGLGGRHRPVSTDAERARLTVTKGIKSAIAKIRASHPALAHHLANCVKTGSFCSYTPDSPRPIDWQL